MSNGRASQMSCAVFVSLRVAVWLTLPVVMRILGTSRPPKGSCARWSGPMLRGSRQERRHALHHRLGHRKDVPLQAVLLSRIAVDGKLATARERPAEVGAAADILEALLQRVKV